MAVGAEVVKRRRCPRRLMPPIPRTAELPSSPTTAPLPSPSSTSAPLALPSTATASPTSLSPTNSRRPYRCFGGCGEGRADASTSARPHRRFARCHRRLGHSAWHCLCPALCNGEYKRGERREKKKGKVKKKRYW